MKEHSFYFRCKACNRLLTNHARKSSDGVIREPDLCSVCMNSAFDDAPGREYHHQSVSDEFGSYDSDKNSLD